MLRRGVENDLVGAEIHIPCEVGLLLTLAGQEARQIADDRDPRAVR